MQDARDAEGMPGPATRGVRPDIKKPQTVKSSLKPPASANLDQFDHRHLDRQAAALLEAVLPIYLEFGQRERAAVFDHSQLGRRTAHVEGQQIVDIRQLAEVRAGERTASRAGLEQAQWKATGRLDGRDAA